MSNRRWPAIALHRRSLMAAMLACAVPASMATTARASDFSQFCEANSSLESGKLSDADKKSCACIKAKLDAKTQDEAGSALEKVLANRKAGKSEQKPDLTPDQDKAIQAFVSAMQGCVSPTQ